MADNKTIDLSVNRTSEEERLRAEFRQLVDRYSQPLYWKIRRIVVDHDDADDVLQNVFVKAWKNIGDFRQQSKVSTWLYRIAVNESLDFIRRRRNTTLVGLDADGGYANRLMADEFFDGDEAQARLQAAVARLPEVQRVVFSLRYYDEMKYSEMSQVLDTSEGALKASYHIAVKKITEYLKTDD